MIFNPLPDEERVFESLPRPGEAMRARYVSGLYPLAEMGPLLRRQGAQVGLKLILGHDEEDDEFHRRIVERLELDAVGGAPEGGDHLIHSIGRSVSISIRRRSNQLDSGSVS